jgi:hypothetical protein
VALFLSLFIASFFIDVWFPFGERNDPKLRRSFNRGVRYADYPRLLPLKTTTSADVSINPEIQEKCNSENEKPKNIIQKRTTAVQADIIKDISKPTMDEGYSSSSKPPRQIEERSFSTTSTTTDFDNNQHYSPSSTSKCFCSCRNSSSAANTQNGSMENMSMNQNNSFHCSNNSSNFSPSSFVPYNNNSCTTSPFQPQHHWPFPPQNYWPHSPFNIPPTSPVSVSFAFFFLIVIFSSRKKEVFMVKLTDDPLFSIKSTNLKK